MIVQGYGLGLISKTPYSKLIRHIEPPIDGFSSPSVTVRYFQTESLAAPGLVAQVRVTVRLRVSVNPVSAFIAMCKLVLPCYKFSNVNMPQR